MRRSRFSTWLLTIALVLSACGTKSQVLHAPKSTGKTVKLTEPSGWRFIKTSSAELRLVSADPQGHGFFMAANVIGDRDHDLLVTVDQQEEMVKPAFRRITFATPAHYRIDIVDLPWGDIALEAGSDRSNESGGVVSPDLRYIAIPLADGLWLGEIETGQGRIITLPPPAKWPEELGQYNPLHWASQPRWSPDSNWIYFQSNRLKPYTMRWWRIAVAGGPEELVEGQILADERPVAREVKGGPSIMDRIQADGLFFRSFSPDWLWAAADKIDAPMFRLYDLEYPEASITYVGPPNHYAETWYDSWSPDSGKILFHQRAVSGVAPVIGVLNLNDGGSTTFYLFPDPKAGRAHAVGFVGNDHLLVALQQWNANLTDVQSHGWTQWWLLDLTKAAPLKALPTSLSTDRKGADTGNEGSPPPPPTPS